MQDKLKKIYDKKQLVQINRENLTGQSDIGFILGLNSEFVLFQNCIDFVLNGYTVIKISDITSLRSSEHERLFEKILKGEGTLDEVGIPYDVNLDSWQSLLQGLKEMNKNVMIECEVGDEDEDDFFIGKLIQINQDSVSLLFFSDLGIWDDEPDVIPFDEITKVRFDEKYINVFSKYLT